MEEVKEIISRYKELGADKISIIDVAEIIKLLQKDKEEQLLIQRVSITEGQSCKCGNKTFTHRHTNCIECTSCNKIKVLQD